MVFIPFIPVLLLSLLTTTMTFLYFFDYLIFEGFTVTNYYASFNFHSCFVCVNPGRLTLQFEIRHSIFLARYSLSMDRPGKTQK